MTRFKADQMIQFARVVGLEVSLASFGMLEDLFLKAKVVRGRNGDVEKLSGRSSFPGRAGTVVSESLASRSVYPLPTISESAEIDKVADVGSREPSSSGQAPEALSSSPTACGWSGTDCLKTLYAIKADL